MEPDIFCQQPLPRPQLRQVQLQHRLSGRHRRPLREPEERRLFYLRQLGHILRLPVEPSAHGHHRVHLLFQQAAAAGVLAGDGILGVFHALLDATVFLQLFIVLLPLLPGLPGLVRDCVRPAADIGGIVQPVNAAPGRFPFSGMLHVEYHGCSVLDKGLIMGDIQHASGKSSDKIPQPLQCLQIQIAGGLIQQQRRRTAEQQPSQLELDPFPAGETGDRSAAVKFLRRKPELPRDIRQLPGRHVKEIRRGGAEVVHAPRLLLLAKVLGQIAQKPRVPCLFTAPLAVRLDQARIIDPFQQGRFSVALLPDDGSLVPVVDDKGKVRRQVPQVLPVGQCQIFYLNHSCVLPSSGKRKTLSDMPKAYKNTAGRDGNRPWARQSETLRPGGHDPAKK